MDRVGHRIHFNLGENKIWERSVKFRLETKFKTFRGKIFFVFNDFRFDLNRLKIMLIRIVAQKGIVGRRVIDQVLSALVE